MPTDSSIPNYANQEVEALFDSFDTDEDREWGWMVLNELIEAFPRADHYFTGGIGKSYTEICIGKKNITATKGNPVFSLGKEAKNKGGGACLYLANVKNREYIDSFSELDWWIKQQESDAEQVKDWIAAISKHLLLPEDSRLLDGNGHSPRDYQLTTSTDGKSMPRTSSETISGSNISLNTILYGPPGTGKTYNTINEAIKIIDPDFFRENEADRSALKNRFDKLSAEKKIVMTTFHQSFSYEDFVEGIRAEVNDDGQLEYKVESGILKEIAETAKTMKESNFDQVYEQLCEEIEESGLLLETLVHRKPFDIEMSSRNNLVAIPRTKTKTRMTITKENLKNFIFGQGKVEWKPYTLAVTEYLKTKYHLTVDQEKSNYVLIIDEINRGNISNIFGELITLIEDSKRKGADEALSITLPYSKDEFSIPENLYLIGTMNTADRSLTQIDTALRRRFHFREMMPEPELLAEKEIEGVNLRDLLTCLNQRIEALYDREHTLGHAFFIHLTSDSGISELREVFENKIFPLLQEYFFEDWKKIQLVLGKEFVTEETFDQTLFNDNEAVEELNGTQSYAINKAALSTPEAYQRIYQKQRADTE